MTSSDDNVKYGRKHRVARAQALTAFVNGQPCVRCGQAMRAGESMDLDHAEDGTSYLGLSHSSCNRRAGGAKGAATTAALYFGTNTKTTAPQPLCNRCGNPACRRAAGYVTRCW